jgi:hypothetical protein
VFKVAISVVWVRVWGMGMMGASLTAYARYRRSAEATTVRAAATERLATCTSLPGIGELPEGQ